MSIEKDRLQEAKNLQTPWRKWGPYLSERQWGTVREDYSHDGSAWDYFTHDQARSRAYQWGEDGLAGVSDDKQKLCFALALWNGKDAIVKERLFGLSNSEGNHGEDVKECYFYLDNTPTHSYMKYLYKYPQAAFPYDDLVKTNHKRSRNEAEYELIDTGIFENSNYHDVFVEYAKNSPEDLLIKITVCNRSARAAAIHLLPTLWFRNTWSWSEGAAKPELSCALSAADSSVVAAEHAELGRYYLHCSGKTKLLFTENETNQERIFKKPNPTPYVKDGIVNHVIGEKKGAVNPAARGTKVAAHYTMIIPAKGEVVVRLRLNTRAPEAKAKSVAFGPEFEQIFQARVSDANEFYKGLTPPKASADEAMVMRQALAGMLWTKQYYHIDLALWLKQHGTDPLHGGGVPARNRDWFHLLNDHVISMPDKWEYPWYAAWDLAFHMLAFSAVDPEFAKEQLLLLMSEVYMHPNGQIPAYEWNFGDVNPPVYAWATLYVYQAEKRRAGAGDLEFLKRTFAKLTINFTWWVNRKDRLGKNVFEGGFLGLDNIGVFDRSSPLPTGGFLEQADGTAWMALYCQNMLEMAVELASYDKSYEDMAVKFAEHFFWIAAAMNRSGKETPGLWDEEDGFYFDLLRTPDGQATHLKVRSLVGLLPLCAVMVGEKYQREAVPWAAERVRERLKRVPELTHNVHVTGPGSFGVEERGLLAVVNEERLRRMLTRMLDPKEFFSPFGIRSLSRHHVKNPYRYMVGAQEYRVDYVPGDSLTGMFGGNSNWRGPVWFPMNALIIRALTQYYLYYGDSFKIECPTGSGKMKNLYQVAEEISTRLTRLFLRNRQGRRPCHGTSMLYQTDPHWRDLVLFYEYFHGDRGIGIGANHQTGWTGLVAELIQAFGMSDAKSFLARGRK